MAKRRKYKFRSRVEAEEAYEKANDEQFMEHIALHEVLNGNVKWFREGSTKIGLIRPLGVDGGLVVIRTKTSTSVFTRVERLDTFTGWIDHEVRSGILSVSRKEDRDLMSLRDKLVKARRQAVDEELEKAS